MVCDSSGHAVRVLIADDDPRVRAAWRALFVALDDFDVVGAVDSAARAITMARERGPAVALVDILLPDARDGLGLLRALTGELHIPAVAVSIQSGLGSQALDAGAYRFLTKDSPPELLIWALRTAATQPEGRRSSSA